MRFAVVAVSAAFVGVTGVLLSMRPPLAEASHVASNPTLIAPVGGGAAGAQDVGTAAAIGACPPCQSAPLGPSAWREALGRGGSEAAIERAAALSLAMREPKRVQAALQAEDPALRELAALLLNVTSGRVSGCTPVAEGGGRVAAVLDRLDQLVAMSQSGTTIPARDLASAAAAAAVLNRGEGLPAGCGR